ncbi:hypothetical protein METBIDRAFT_32966 [Metschnikowia bicuspidata var. bicuspidata NRRL YB-4993]|uniref:Uncharacterized protein n=1 Tax=Metschnikowia bicuspidata var. bicuspidata NRRL YB-4993 TaxID=869754 RepID=A0A1A0H785_9ASCO|nr:hypothetical protein METBIDRAFT_32966 [Metschnikowia bicuspidata var. bicuspidata NRRL YB-4993]OBA19954.1 hypothetical protein METBIDRAFT_32966 [Metschnikowia bicuspidata var. bicuspidata NRRL YB-4993]
MWCKLRKKLLLLLILLAVIILFVSQTFSYSNVQKLRLNPMHLEFTEHDTKLRTLLHFSNYKFSLADAFEDEVGGWDAFAAKPKPDRCLSFFNFVDAKWPEWEVELFRSRQFDKSIVKKDSMIKSLLKKSKSGADSPPETIEKNKDRANKTYDRKLKETISLEQDMADTMTIIRLFGHCFFDGDSLPVEGKLKEIYNRYSAKVVPFFNAEIPEVFANDSELEIQDAFDMGLVQDNNLLDFYYKNMKGTGIVLSMATRHSRDVIRLIHVLRALGNTLPIEILYRSDLLRDSKKAILLAASLQKTTFLGDKMTDHKIFKKALDRAGASASDVSDLDFPKQKVTFIDMQRTLTKLTRSDFSDYDNKLLALFFNSFENAFLFDVDAVPLLPVEQLRNLKEFSDTGAYFFRDRNLMDKNDWIETNFFAKLMPHESDKIDMAMGIKPVTTHTLGNSYMKGWRHCQEAGLVMVNRRRHFRALLTLLPLSLWGEPIGSLIWGDKEMYWLSMSVAGDENYTFNKYGASSVGELTAETSLKHYNNTKSFELCSSHPGHVAENGQLLWINSGFSYCKKNGYSRDKSKFPFSAFQDKDEMKNLYENPLRIRHAILPPELPTLRDPNGSPDLSRELLHTLADKKRKKDVDEMPGVDQIDTHDPQKGWIKSQTCANYQYCAYNAIQALDAPGQLDESGHVFQFDAESIKRYDILGAIWSSSLIISDLPEETPNETLIPDSDNGSDRDVEYLSSLVSAADLFSPLDEIFKFWKWEKNTDSEREDLKSSEHSEELIATGLLKEEKGKSEKIEGGTVRSDPESEIHYDPSEVRHRPEKLRNAVNDVLARIQANQ